MPQATHILGLHEIELFAANTWTGTAEKLVQIQLTFMAEETSFDNTFVASLATETYFAVKLHLLR